MQRKTANELPPALLAGMAAALRVLGHPERLRLVDLLDRDGPLPVHALVARLGLAQAAASHHLGRMRAAGLVAAERRGQETWYRIANPHSVTILNCIRRKAGNP